MAERELLLGLAVEIVSAHARNNAVPTDQLPALIQQVFNTLASAEQKFLAPSKPEPAVPISQSVRVDHLACLDCGKHLLMLRRHLRMDHQLTPEQYRQRWGLPVSYHGCIWLRQGAINYSEEDRTGANWSSEARGPRK